MMFSTIYGSEQRLDNSTLYEMKCEMHEKMEIYGLWSSLSQKLEPIVQLDGTGNQKYNEIENLKIINEGLNRYIEIEVAVKNANGDIANKNLYENFYFSEDYEPDISMINVNVIWNPDNLKTSMSNVRVQDIKRQQEIDMYMQAYYLSIIGIGHFNPIFATAISVIVDYGINDTYYLLRDSKGFVPNGKTYSQISKEGLDVASHLFKMYKIANSKDAENEAAKDILTSLGSGIHYDIDNYDYLASYQICDPYIIQNIKTLEEEGLGRMANITEDDIEDMAYRIGYSESSEYYQYFIIGKEEEDINIYQRCYNKLLYGKGNITFDKIDPIILNDCLEEIQKKAGENISIKRGLVEYGQKE